ncbi:MAG: hypothetical protein DRO13_01230 [Thermoprotei archaeon]|nr:MAG: hypothetical protein DRO13_01230 [Thermoprotei archaeon]
MPKTPSVILREELSRMGYELLDIYQYRDRDIIRIKHRMSGKIFLYETKRHVRDLVSRDEIRELASSIAEYYESRRVKSKA